MYVPAVALPDLAQNFVTVFLGIFIEAAPFLLLGALASGLIVVFISPEDIARVMPRNRFLATLVGALLGRICAGKPPRLEPQALRALENYSFPGNVRELENILERATALCANDAVGVDDLQLAPVAAAEGSAGRDGETLDDYINRIEKQAILEALNKTAFNRTAAARLLGVSFRSLRYRIERLSIEE